MKKRSMLLLFLGAAAALLLLIAAVLHSPPVRRYALERLREYLKSSQGIDLSAESLKYNLLTLSVELDGVVLRSTHAPDLPPFLSADSIRAGTNLISLIRGRPIIEDARLERVDVEIVTDTEGENNLPSGGSSSSGPPDLPLRLLIADLQARGSALGYVDLKRNIRIDLPRWMLRIEGDPSTWTQFIRFQLQEAGRVNLQKRSLPVNGLVLSMELNPSALELKELRVEAGDSRLRAEGVVKDFNQPEIQSMITAELNAGRLAQFAGIQSEAEGNIEVRASISGPPDNILVSCEISGADLGFGNFRRIDLKAAAAYIRESGRIRIDSLDADSPYGSISARANLSVSDESGESSTNIQFKHLDLETLSGRLLPIRIASLLRGNMSLQWKGLDFEKAEIAADLRLSATRTEPVTDVLPFSGRISASGTESRIRLKLASGEVLGMHARGDISIADRIRLGGRIRAETGHMEHLLAGLEAFLGREPGSLVGTRLEGPLKVDAGLGGTFDALQATARVEAPDTHVGRLRNVKLEANGRYAPEGIFLDSLNAMWKRQTLTASGEIGLGGKSPALNLRARVKDGSLDAVAAGIGKNLPVRGVFNLAVDAGGPLADPDLSTSISISDLAAYGQDFGKLDLEGGLHGGTIELARLEIVQPLSGKSTGRLTASGSYDLGSGAYTFRSNATQLAFTDMALPNGLSIRGNLDFSARGSGSVKEPSLNATMALDGLELNGRQLGAFELEARLEEQVLNLEAKLPRFNIVSNAGIGIRSPYPAKFAVKADTDLSKLSLQLPGEEALEGSVTATLDGSADLARWRDGSFSFLASNLQIKTRNGSIGSQGPLELTYENRALSVHSATLVTGNSSLSVSGSLPLEAATGPGTMTAAGSVDLSDLLAFVPEKSGLSAGGILHVNAALHGSLVKIEPVVKLAMSDGTFDHSALRNKVENIHLNALYDKGIAEIRAFSANLGPATIKASGEFPFESLGSASRPAGAGAGKEAQFSVDVESLRMSDLRMIPDAVNGKAGFHLEGSTPRLRELAELRMKVIFSQFEFKTGGYEIEQAEPVQVSVAGGTLSFDRLRLTAPATSLEAHGTVGLVGDQALDVHLDGNVNIGIASLFSEAFKAQGESRFKLDLSGEIPAPRISGFFEMDRGEFSVQSPPLTASNLDVRLRFGSTAADIEKFTGSLNGGRFEVTGKIGYGKSHLKEMHADISVTDAFMNYPNGFRTRITADLTLRSDGEFVTVGGKADILEGSYSRQLDVAEELIGALQSGGGVRFAGEQNPLLSRLRFDIDIDTQRPLLVDNNLADLSADADLRLTGTYYRPGLIGRITLDEGGKLRFNERTYLIERGTVSFVNQAEIEPDLDILATTEVSGYDISLNLSGTPGKFKASLTSDPQLSQPDIISVLLTGRKLENLQGSGLNIARQQAESYLTGQVGGFLSREAERGLGLSVFRIDPSLISPEANPGARLTVGEDITRRLSLIYSMNLVDASDQILTAQYDIRPRFQAAVTRQSDNSYRFDLSQDLKFGGASNARKSAAGVHGERRIGAIEFRGNTVFPHAQLLDRLGLDAGKKFDFFKLQKGLDRLRRYYHERGYLECRIDTERKDAGQSVNVSIDVEAGPEVEIAYTGATPDGDVVKRIRSIWSNGVFDRQRTFEATQAIRNSLARKGYLQAKVTSDVSSVSGNKKRVTFEIDEGLRYHDVALKFDGASGIDPSELKSALENAKLVRAVDVEPEKAIRFLRDYYRQHGYLDAKIEDPRRELNPKTETGTIAIPLKEGPKFSIRKIEFEGNKALTDREIRSFLPVKEGAGYEPGMLLTSVDRLKEKYWTLGYNNALVDYELKRSPESGKLDIEFRITENRQQVVKKVEIEGNRETSKKLIRSQIALSEGDVLDYRKTNKSRRQLYDTTAYTLVDIQSTPIHEKSELAAGNREPVALKVKVTEVRPFRLSYGGFYDTERGPGGIAEFSNRNSLGSARLVGTRIRYDSDVQELRGYFSQPLLRRFPVQTDITGFFRKEFTAGQNTPNLGSVTVESGFTLQQEVRFRNHFILDYGYRFQHNRMYEVDPNPSPAEIRDTAPLTATLLRDTRNDLLDASHGSFVSQAIEYAPSYLGSDIRYFKYFGQYFHYFPLSKPTKIPWVGRERSRLVAAGAVRVGLAAGFDGQDIIQADKFFAGGGTTVRGFGQNEIGPKDSLGIPLGGNSLLILNGELRFPLFSVFDGVGFVDAGNVYPRIQDFNPTDLRAASGFGLRIRTPYFLLRADYGIKLNRKPGESFGKFFFSIGQAF